MITTINDLKNTEPKLLFDNPQFYIKGGYCMESRPLRDRLLLKHIDKRNTFLRSLDTYLDNLCIKGDESNLITILNFNLNRYRVEIQYEDIEKIKFYNPDANIDPIFGIKFIPKRKPKTHSSFESSKHFRVIREGDSIRFINYIYPMLWGGINPIHLTQFCRDWWHKRLKKERDNYLDNYEGNSKLSSLLTIEFMKLSQEELEKWLID